MYSGELFAFDQFQKTMDGQGVTIPSSMSDSDLGNKLSRPSSASKQKGKSSISLLTLFLLVEDFVFCNNLDPDQDRQIIGPDMDSNCLTL